MAAAPARQTNLSAPQAFADIVGGIVDLGMNPPTATDGAICRDICTQGKCDRAFAPRCPWPKLRRMNELHILPFAGHLSRFELQVDQVRPGEFYGTLVKRCLSDASQVVLHFTQMLMPSHDAAVRAGVAAIRSQQEGWGSPMAMDGSERPCEAETIPAALLDYLATRI